MKIKADTILKADIKERIRNIEDYSDIRFPKAYLNFIQKYNVGVPETCSFEINNHSYAVERFLGFINDYKDSPLGDYDIAVVLSQIDTRLTDNPDKTGDELIPIAMMFAGDYVCLDFRHNANIPEVCIWFHEESNEFKPVTNKVANTFEEFIEMLK